MAPVAGLGATVAVKVTPCPLVEGLFEEASAVVVGALLTVCARTAELLAASLASPL